MATYIKTIKQGENIIAPRTVAEAVFLDDGTTTVADALNNLSAAAEDIIIDDVGEYFTSENVEGALQEIGNTLNNLSADATDISFTPEGNISATNVQAAIEELDTEKIGTNQLGVPSGVAELDEAGFVLQSQLPSYVDDVLEYANFAAFPVTGEAHKIYIAIDTHLIYRWGGTEYVEINPSLALGETSATAYRGDKGKIAYDHIFLTDNPHSVTAAQVGAATIQTYTGTITTTWTGSTAPFTQIVTVTGITSSDQPILDVTMSGTYATDEARDLEWSFIYRAVTGTNNITFYAREKNTISLPFTAKVIK